MSSIARTHAMHSGSNRVFFLTSVPRRESSLREQMDFIVWHYTARCHLRRPEDSSLTMKAFRQPCMLQQMRCINMLFSFVGHAGHLRACVHA